MSSRPAQDLLINRKIIEQAEIADSEEGSRPLQEGQVRLVIDRFGLSANNITYAAMGDMMNYWDIYPARDGWGRIPVWGFADIIESRCSGLSVGERVYGLFPASSHVILKAGQVSGKGFMDVSPHRAVFASIYNSYVRLAADHHFRNESHDWQVALRPLFMTSFLIDAFLAQHDFFGANTIIFGSASSKTAFGTAALLKANRQNRRDYIVIGLTSTANLEFVKSLDCYDVVQDYASVPKLGNDAKTVYVDMSGNIRVRKSVHVHFGENLVYSSWVGVTHWTKLGLGIQLPGPEPVLFFAPTEFQNRMDELGDDVFNRQFHAAWCQINDTAQAAISLRHVEGDTAILQAYQGILSGTCGPSAAHVMSFG